MLNKVILDFEAEPCDAIAQAVEYGRCFGVAATVKLMRGPSGWPVVEFVGGWAELDALLTNYYRGTDREAVLHGET